MMKRVRSFQHFLRQYWDDLGYHPVTGYHKGNGTSVVMRLNCVRFRFPVDRMDQVGQAIVECVGGMVRSVAHLDKCHGLGGIS